MHETHLYTNAYTHTREHDRGSHHVDEVCAELAQGSVLYEHILCCLPLCCRTRWPLALYTHARARTLIKSFIEI